MMVLCMCVIMVTMVYQYSDNLCYVSHVTFVHVQDKVNSYKLIVIVVNIIIELYTEEFFLSFVLLCT